MHGRTGHTKYPLGRAPFAGIALLAFVLVSVIGGYSAWQYRDSKLATAAVEREIRGLDFVTRAMTTLVDWGRAGADAFGRSPEIEADIAALAQSAAAMPDVKGAAGAVVVIKRARDAARVDPGPATFAAFGEAMLEAIARIADASGLAFDPEGEPNALGDALDNPLALEFERLNAAFETTRASGARASTIPQRLTVAGQIGAAETASAPLAVDLRGAFAQDWSARARLEQPWAEEERAAASLRTAMTEATAGQPAPHTLESTHARLVSTTAGFTSALADSVRELLEQRLKALARDRVAIVVQCALGIVLSFLVAYLIARDVIRRQRRALYRAQRDSAAEHFRTVFERSPMGIALLDAAGATIDSNAGLGRMLDAREPRIVPDGDPEYAELVEGHVALYRFERHWTRSDGTSLWAEVTVSPVGGPHFGRVVAIAMIQDITERRASDATLRFAATHDALTALPNRAEFMRHLNEVIASEAGACGRYAVLFIDLDEFKAVNDRLGHLAGDRVLETAAERIRKASRTSDLVARFHGDEFGLLLVGVDGMRVAGGVAERVQEELRAPIFIDGHRVFVAPSIGIVLGDPRYTRAEDVLRDADSAMYKAKSLGGSRSVAFEYPAAS